jgi:hypothetical protein
MVDRLLEPLTKPRFQAVGAGMSKATKRTLNAPPVGRLTVRGRRCSSARMLRRPKGKSVIVPSQETVVVQTKRGRLRESVS